MRTHRDSTHIEKGPSLAKGPAWIVGSVLAVFGLVLFWKAPGTPLPTAGFPDGQATGTTFLGFEINAWTAWLTTAAGVLVLIGVLQHVIAKTMSLLVGLALGAASVIALVDGDDVFGLAAANGFTALGWGVAAAILIIAALLPRRTRQVEDHRRTEAAAHTTKHDTRHDSTDGRHDGRHDSTDGRHDGRRADGDFRGTGDAGHADLPGRVEPVTTSGTPTSADTDGSSTSRSGHPASTDDARNDSTTTGQSVHVPTRNRD
ncbi:MAG: hypothetical protein Q7T55_21835 [Solirubrobacteraceae bacterium]|nr:hypothetical protein [Solirubrobacteraceae bacterium]